MECMKLRSRHANNPGQVQNGVTDKTQFERATQAEDLGRNEARTMPSLAKGKSDRQHHLDRFDDDLNSDGDDNSNSNDQDSQWSDSEFNDAENASLGSSSTITVMLHKKQKVVRKRGAKDDIEASVLSRRQMLDRTHKKNEKLRRKAQQIKKLKERLKALEIQIEGQKAVIARQTTSISNMQSDRFLFVQNKTVFHDADQDIASRIEAVFELSRVFSKQFCVSNIQAVSDEDMRIMAAFLCESSSEQGPSASKRMSKAILARSIPLHVIVNAVVNKFLVTRVFNEPLQYLDFLDPDMNISYTFKWLIDTAKHRSSDYSRRLFSSFVRAIDHPERKDNQMMRNSANRKAILVSRRLEKAKKEHNSTLIKELMERTSSAINKDAEDGSYIRGLTDIILQTSCLSSRLAAQNSRIEFQFYKTFSRQAFSLQHTKMIPHRALKIDVDEGSLDPAYKRRHPDLIIKPALVRFGSADGGDSLESTKRFLEKAVIWIVKRSEAETSDSKSKKEKSKNLERVEHDTISEEVSYQEHQYDMSEKKEDRNPTSQSPESLEVVIEDKRHRDRGQKRKRDFKLEQSKMLDAATAEPIDSEPEAIMKLELKDASMTDTPHVYDAV